MNDNDNMEERLRQALRAVAELPGRPPSASGPPERKGQRNLLSPVLHRPRLVASILTVAAIAAAISLLVVYGPHGASGPLSHPNIPASHPTTSTTTPSTTLPPPPSSTTTTTTSTTTTTVPAVTVGTEQITYQPFVGSTLDPSLHVTGQLSGACFEYGGGADGRSYYRCGTLQPCFEGPQGSGAPLVCPSGDVTADNVVEFSATSIDTSYLPATTRTPWAMQLSTGQVCTLVNAAWSGLGPFGCDGTPVADCHQPQASSPLWTTDCQDQLSGASPFTATSVEKIWF